MKVARSASGSNSKARRSAPEGVVAGEIADRHVMHMHVLAGMDGGAWRSR